MKKVLKIAPVSLFWIGVWWLLSELVSLPLLFPSPIAVIGRLFELLGTKAFYLITLRSLGGILLGIVIAVALGVLLAVLTSAAPPAREVFFPLLSCIRATPVASFIILLFIFVGERKVPIYITVLMVLPIVWTNLDEGFRQIDPKLRQVTKAFRFTKAQTFRYLIFPSVSPYFSSALRTSLGIAWKAGIAAEVIARTSGSIGEQIDLAKQYLISVDLFAWTLTVVLLSLVIEAAVSSLQKRFSQKTTHGKEKEYARMH